MIRVLFCSDIRLGMVCTENLGGTLLHRWQETRADKFSEMLDLAAQKRVPYVALFGRLFGQDRVTESIIDTLFQTIKRNSELQVLAFLTIGEYNRVIYRNDIPENLHLICVQKTGDFYEDPSVRFEMEQGVTRFRISESDWFEIEKTGNNSFVIQASDKEYAIPAFEPIGFEDAKEKEFGFGLLEVKEDGTTDYLVFGEQKYLYDALVLKIMPEDGQKDIVFKINSAVSKIPNNTLLRITLVGKSAFGLTFNCDALATQLQSKVFFAEVYDNTIMDIDEEAFETDISLRSEFVRLALQDDTLSESERNKIISCGWNALLGKEVASE